MTSYRFHLLRSRTAELRITYSLLILILGRAPLPAAARYSASPAGSQLLRPARGRSRGSRRGTPSLKRVRQPLRISAPKASKGRSQEIRGGALSHTVLAGPTFPTLPAHTLCLSIGGVCPNGGEGNSRRPLPSLASSGVCNMCPCTRLAWTVSGITHSAGVGPPVEGMSPTLFSKFVVSSTLV